MICPHCGEESFAKKKNVLSGWKITGTIQVCALCGAEWPSKEETQTAKTEEARRAERLSALLGGETAEKVTLAGEADRSFCRNCAHFLAHPFKCVCALSGKEIDPGDDGCGKFAEKE